jgi:urease accessory protein
MSLLVLSSPTLPAGGFAYSDGLEQLLHRGRVRTTDELEPVLHAHYVLNVAGGDAWFARHGHRAATTGDAGRLSDLAREEAVARMPLLGRDACVALGRNLLRVAAAAADGDEAPGVDWLAASMGDAPARATAFGGIAAVFGVPEDPAVDGFLFSAATALVESAVRLGISPALRSQGLLRRMLSRDVAGRSHGGSPEYCSPLIDIAVAAHEAADARHFAT